MKKQEKEKDIFNHTRQLEGDTLISKKTLFKCFRNWYWYLLTVMLALGFAYIYNQYTTPIFEIKSSMLVEEGNTVSSIGGSGAGQSIFQGLGMMNSMQNINNQMVLLSSTPIIAKTLQELNFEVSYHSVGRFASKEQYQNVPFQVVWEKNHPQIINADFHLIIQPNGKLVLSMEEEDGVSVFDYVENRVVKNSPGLKFSREINAGTKVSSDEFAFTILLKDYFDSDSNNQFKFRFHSPDALITRYQKQLKIDLKGNETTILNLTLRDYNVRKGMAFLNKLTEVYQSDNLEKKNENANRTIHFISSQLASISDSLNISESLMETFQSENQVLDISMQSQQLLEQMKDLDRERVALEAQNKYYHYLRDYISKTANEEFETVIAPSAMGIQDPLLNNLILQLNDLINEKLSNTSIRRDSNHPTILRLNAQIESVKNSLKENVNNIISQSDLALNSLNQRIRIFEAQARRLPATERNYVNIERKYKLNNETYTFLLQKLSEAQIAKASNIPDTQMIEEARISGSGPVEPQKSEIYAMALLLGLVFPTLVIIMLDLLNNKIMSKDDIESMIHFPIIGQVFNNQKEYSKPTLVLDKPNSPASEPYSAIRTKLDLIAKGKEHVVVAVTSSFPGEGKSYNSINIASSIALSNKTAVILDLDLRKSKLGKDLGLKLEKTVVDFIVGKASLEEITYKTKHPRLKVIPAGPHPPNPAQMLSDERLVSLIEQLKNIYDVIIMDTPPVGVVADFLLLRKMIDATVFVVRHKSTPKKPLKEILEELESHEIEDLGIIVNNVYRTKSNRGYGYGYGYGHGYGYGYAQDQ